MTAASMVPVVMLLAVRRMQESGPERAKNGKLEDHMEKSGIMQSRELMDPLADSRAPARRESSPGQGGRTVLRGAR